MAILTKLNKKNFDEILENYKIGKHKSHKHINWAIANTVYVLNTTKGKYIFKIFEKSDPKFIEFQVKIMNFVQSKNLPIAKVIKTKNGKNLLIFKNKRILIQEFVNGKELKKLNSELIKDIAKKQSSLNKNLLKLKLYGKYAWGKDYQFEPMFFKASKFDNFDIDKNKSILLKEIRKLKREKLRKGVVHGDFNSSNLLIKNNKLEAIIDWDDVHEDFFIHEIVCFIAHSFVTQNKINKKQMKLYLKEYQKNLKLNKEEKKAIYFLIKHRYLIAISWTIEQIKNHKDQEKNIKKRINKMINQYLIFNKMSLDEFMEFFEE